MQKISNFQQTFDLEELGLMMVKSKALFDVTLHIFITGTFVQIKFVPGRLFYLFINFILI